MRKAAPDLSQLLPNEVPQFLVDKAPRAPDQTLNLRPEARIIMPPAWTKVALAHQHGSNFTLRCARLEGIPGSE